VYLGNGKFEYFPYSTGSEDIVATATVPKNSVWRVPVGEPLVVALVAKQTITVASGDSGVSKTLDPEAPVVDFMPNIADGEYTADANVVAYYDESGDGSKDTLVTDSTGVSYSGNVSSDGDFIDAVEFSGNGAEDETLDVYTVVRNGYTRIQKRTSGKGNSAQELQTEDSITWAFSNPDDPNSDRQITWDPRNSGLRGVIPPKFKLDLVFFDKDYATALDAEKVEDANLEISIPVRQRPVREDEDPATLRRKVANNMSGP
jgi:hypothetical protein